MHEPTSATRILFFSKFWSRENLQGLPRSSTTPRRLLQVTVSLTARPMLAIILLPSTHPCKCFSNSTPVFENYWLFYFKSCCESSLRIRLSNFTPPHLQTYKTCVARGYFIPSKWLDGLHNSVFSTPTIILVLMPHRKCKHSATPNSWKS